MSKNGEKFIKDSIDSILNQSFTNFEFLIMIIIQMINQDLLSIVILRKIKE